MSPDLVMGVFHVPSLITGVLVGIAVLAAALVPYLIRLERRAAQMAGDLAVAEGATAQMDAQFKSVAMDALKSSQEQFLALASERLKNLQQDAGHDLDKRQAAIAALVDPIGKTLKDVETRLEGLGQAGAVLDAQLKSFAEDQKMLRAQTGQLVQVLKNPAARGRWGEVQLARVLEHVGMVEGVHFAQQQRSNPEPGRAQQPDFVVSLPGALRIVIDVKTPLDPYWSIVENRGEESLSAPVGEDQIRSFREHLRSHVKTLSTKEYWRQFDSPAFVVMFLPTEGLFSLAVSSDKTLIEDAASAGVILASPTTILGLLRVIMYGWQQQALADNARQIGDLAVELQGRMGTFLAHLQKVGRNLGTASDAYNQAIGAMESRVLPQLRKMEELQGQKGGALAELPRLEQSVRTLSAVPPSDEEAA